MNVLKYGLLGMVILATALVLTGCNDKKTSTDSPEVVSNENLPKAKKDIQIKNGATVTVKEIQDFEKEHQGKNLTRKYVVSRLLDEKYPMDKKVLDEKVATIKKDLGDTYDAYLKKNQLTEATLKEEVKYDHQVYQLGVDSLGLTEEKLKAAYDSWVPSMEIQHIMVNDEKTIKEVKQKLDDGADFTELVKEYSVDEQTKKEDGHWKNLKKGDLLSSLEKEVNQLGEGEVSKPIKTIMGWHIVKLLKSSEKKSYDEVKEQVKQDYIDSKLTSNYLESVIDELLIQEVSPLDNQLKKVLGLE